MYMLVIRLIYVNSAFSDAEMSLIWSGFMMLSTIRPTIVLIRAGDACNLFVLTFGSSSALRMSRSSTDRWDGC